MGRHAVYNHSNLQECIRALISGQQDIIDVTSPATSLQELRIPHGLGRMPKGWSVLTGDAIGSDTTNLTPAGTISQITPAGTVSAPTVVIPRYLYFGASSITPATGATACAAPALDASDNWGAAFATTKEGFWDFVLPSDFDGSVDLIEFHWSQATSTGAVTWSLCAVTFADGTADNTAYGAYSDAGADTAGAINQEQVTTLSASSIFGTSSNAKRRCKAKIKATYSSGGVVTLRNVVMEF